ncbi:MAG: trans-sulfuration enzyme family protein [Armatimonadota bacterium]
MPNRHFHTRVVHQARADVEGPGRPVVAPIYQASSFAFPSAEDYADVIQEKREGFVYTRLGNPTFAALHRTMADLENGQAATSFASGMAAIYASLMALLHSGQHVVAHRSVYGGTFKVMTDVLTRVGVQTTFVDATQPARVAEAIRDETAVIYVETICNPTLDVIDVASVAQVAGERNVPVLVDNTFATPYLCRPLDLGATLTIHSGTKFIGGHADVIGGIVVGPADLVERIDHFTRATGGINSPLHAWLMMRGLKTLHLRMQRHCDNALKVAEFLESHPRVERVFYPGLPSHPQHDVASRQLDGSGGVVAAVIAGGRKGGMRFINRLNLCLIAPSLGDVATLVTHPASTTHRQMSREQLAQAGIAEGLVRISVGIEHVDDIISDFDQALAE